MVVNRFCEDFFDHFGCGVARDGSHSESAEDLACKGSFACVVAQLHAGGQEFHFFVVQPHVQSVSASLFLLFHFRSFL